MYTKFARNFKVHKIYSTVHYKVAYAQSSNRCDWWGVKNWNWQASSLPDELQYLQCQSIASFCFSQSSFRARFTMVVSLSFIFGKPKFLQTPAPFNSTVLAMYLKAEELFYFLRQYGELRLGVETPITQPQNTSAELLYESGFTFKGCIFSGFLFLADSIFACNE